MPSALTLCQLALSFIGDNARITNIDPPDGSVQASLCARFYPQVRDSLLCRYPFAFASRWQTLPLLDAKNGLFFYALPADSIRPVRLRTSRAFTVDSQSLITEDTGGELLYCFVQTDSERFSPPFSEALAWHLAADLAGALIKGQSGAAQAKECLTTGERFLRSRR